MQPDLPHTCVKFSISFTSINLAEVRQMLPGLQTAFETTGQGSGHGYKGTAVIQVLALKSPR